MIVGSCTRPMLECGLRPLASGFRFPSLQSFVKASKLHPPSQYMHICSCGRSTPSLNDTVASVITPGPVDARLSRCNRVSSLESRGNRSNLTGVMDLRLPTRTRTSAVKPPERVGPTRPPRRPRARLWGVIDDVGRTRAGREKGVRAHGARPVASLAASRGRGRSQARMREEASCSESFLSRAGTWRRTHRL